jgi:hypothetical protein
LRVFACERVRQPDATEPSRKIVPMQFSRVLELLSQRRLDSAWQYRYAILIALTVPDQYLASGKVHILDAEPHALHDAHSGPVKETPDQRMDVVQSFEYPFRLFARKYDREPHRRFRLLDPLEPWQLDSENFLV